MMKPDPITRRSATRGSVSEASRFASPFARPRSGGGGPVGALQEQAGAPDAASEGLRTGQTPAVREAPPSRRNSGLPVRLLRCLVASVVVPAVALVTERLSP